MPEEGTQGRGRGTPGPPTITACFGIQAPTSSTGTGPLPPPGRRRAYGAPLRRGYFGVGGQETCSLSSAAPLCKKHFYIHLNRDPASPQLPRSFLTTTNTRTISHPSCPHQAKMILIKNKKQTKKKTKKTQTTPSSKNPKANPTKQTLPSPRLIYPLGSDQKGLGSLETHGIDQCWSLHSLRASLHLRPHSPKVVGKFHANPLLWLCHDCA